ncbi:hypothetical protein [Nocardioides sp. B-3]|uniref:hypothetical protein n=1 Tax=Nocardioides sp. B-3 TaxID=2895565 RepID=UPI002152E258|nr:hypothetical protein [Nocardioides sp. B-3]UUZ60515.1 hypothetical protein LP418_06480 [Nocardioides sp. B-3]
MTGEMGVINEPSSGGVERKVANGLGVFYNGVFPPIVPPPGADPHPYPHAHAEPDRHADGATDDRAHHGPADHDTTDHDTTGLTSGDVGQLGTGNSATEVTGTVH